MELLKVKSIVASTDNRLEDVLNALITKGCSIKEVIYLGLNPQTQRLYQVIYKEKE